LDILWNGLIGSPVISKKSSANIGGPLSIGLPDPLNVLPNISSEIGIFNTSPVNSQTVCVLSIPFVPSNICTTAFFPLISNTWPFLLVPSPNVTLTISEYFGNLTSSNITKGPSTPITDF